MAIGFFGVVKIIYYLFASFTKHWDILKNHCTMLTLKSLLETRWEYKLNWVKAIHYQAPELINTLEEIFDITSDPKTKSKWQSLGTNKRNLWIHTFCNLVLLWYILLVEVNTVNKTLENINKDLEMCSNLLYSLLEFLKSFQF